MTGSTLQPTGKNQFIASQEESFPQSKSDMASPDAPTMNGAEKLSENVSSPQVPDDSNVSKKSRRQRRNAAKTQAVSSNDVIDAGPSPPKDAISVMENMPRNWEASLTIAEIKALRSEQATKKHNQQFPPRAKRDTVAKPKKARQVPSAAPKAEPVQKTNPVEKSIAPAQKPDPVQITTSPAADHSGIRYGQPLPPCGIRGCPVKADHERRPYVFNEEDRPSMIKMIQNKADEATEADWKTLDRFFILHEHIRKPATVISQA